MKKTMKMYLAGALMCAATLFAAVSCDDKEENLPEAPAAAGAITGATANVCPAHDVSLSVGEVKNAESYQWYKDGAKITGATVTTYTATASGEYAVAGVNSVGEGTKSAAHAVTISPCAGEDGGVPVAAGTITGPELYNCSPEETVLTVEPVQGATSYSWNIMYAADDVEETITTEPSYTANLADIASFEVGQSVTYTVSGMNSAGKGEISAPHVVTKQLCIAAKPVILGNPDWITERRGDTIVYTTVCPATSMPGTATTTSGGVIRYDWYWQQVGGDADLVPWNTTGDAVMILGGPGYTYNLAVIAITADGPSEMSDVIQVVGSVCYQPNRPGGVSGNVALYPEKLGSYSFYPGTAPYSFGISNCEVQEKTFQSETSVVLYSNSAQKTHDDHPVTGYAFWVKTAADGTFTKVHTTGPGADERIITVDGITYPSGTYQVTAISDHGDSEFGNNWIAVEIRNDCPAPPVVTLAAPTIVQSSGATLIDGVFSNDCPKEIADINLTIPNTPAGTVNNIIWSRLAPNPAVVAEGQYQTYMWDLTPENNGTYSVMYVKTVGSTTYESPAATVTIDIKLCPPAFAKKPTAIVETGKAADEYAEAVLKAPNSKIAPLITSYEWYYNGSVATVADVTNGASSLTFHLLKEGTYKVRAKTTAYGDSEFSEEIILNKVSPPEAYTRADLIGTYSVADWRGANGTSAANYTLTIAEGTEANEITITGLGNTPTVTLKATVSFSADGKTTSNYGTITIPKQEALGGANGTTTYYFTHGTNYANPPTCDDADVVFTIKFVEGGPGVSETGVRYGIYSAKGAGCGGINYSHGSETNVTTWTKQ